MKARLRFHGAAREVTGSMHLLEANGHTVAMDCGMFQGSRALANAKNSSFPCPPTALNAVLISHAHIDHCGKLPRLVREGYRGEIHATAATADLVEVLLADSAHIQEEDTNWWNKKRVKHGDAPIEPLYTQEDVAQTTPLLRRHNLGEPFEIRPGVRVTFFEAGHMLGSAGVHVEIINGEAPRRITFSGDLGRPNIPILRDPDPLPTCDYLICESTYGGRVTPPAEDMKQQFVQALNETFARGGKVIIPSFAVGRTQVMVYYYHQLVREGAIPRVPLIVDSPLASAATAVYRKHPEVFDKEAAEFNRLTGHMFDCDGVQYTENVEASKALHGRSGPMIIVSASGMCEAGRILHHLKNNITDPKNTILIVGYQAANTLGRRLVERQPQVRILGEMYAVRARVKVLNGFGSHANAKELAAASAPLAKSCKQAFLVHGEPDQLDAMAEILRREGFPKIAIPNAGDTFELI
jgi:metallo-beta-lactamase family protein